MTITRQQIESMPAGSEMDAMVAEKVMGWVRWEGPTGFKCFGPPGPGGHRDTPEYSTDMDSAWMVVEKMRHQNPCLILDGENWRFVLDASDDPNDTETVMYPGLRACTTNQRRFSVCDASAPLAISRAALLAELERMNP